MQNKNEIEFLKKRIHELEAEAEKRSLENKKLEDLLNGNEVMLSNILSHSTNAFYSHTANHELTFFSPQIYHILGYQPDEAKVKWTELTSNHSMNEEGFKKTLAAIKTGEIQGSYELELIHKNGKKVYVRVHEAPVVENGKTVAIVGSLTDISDQKITGSGLKESEEKFKLLFEKSRDPILIIDEYNFIECNQATIEKLGYNSVEELIHIHPSKLSPKYQPDQRLSFEKAQEMMDIAYEKGYHRFEWIHMSKTGQEMYMDVALTKIPYKGRNMLFTTWRDISKQKEYEKSLIVREKQYSNLFEQAADGILVGIKGGEIVEANQSMLTLCGYTKEELIGQNISVLFESNELGKKPLRYDLVKKGNTVINERNIVTQKGELVPIEMNTKILDDGRMQALFRDLSKRKEAEKELMKSQELLQNAEIIAGLGNYLYDVNKDVWESSDVLNEIYGIDENYTKNFKNWIKIIHPEYRVEMENYFRVNVLKNKETFDKEYKIVKINDHQERWVHGFGEIELNSENKPINVFGIIQDITERKNSEIELKTNEEKYRNIFNNSPLGILHYDKTGSITDCNDHFVGIIGSSKQRLIGLNMIQDLKNERLIQCLKDSFIKGESVYEDWYSSISANKETFVRILFKRITDHENKTISGVGLVEDITERKRAEQDLRISEEKFKSLATLLPEVIYETDTQGNLKFVNLKAYEIFEYSDEDFKKGLNIFQMLAPEDQGRARLKLGKLSDTYKTVGEKYTAITKNGVRFPILVYSDVVKENNTIIGLRGIIVKIEDLLNAQENLKKSEEKFRLLFESSNDSILLMDKDVFIDCNEKTLQMFKCSRDQIIGKELYAFSANYQPDGIRSKVKATEIIQDTLEGNPRVFEWLHKRYDGTEFFTEVSLTNFEYQQQKVIQVIIRDISERKELEQKIFNTVLETEEKERARLASDIHDEIGPLLSSLKMYIESIHETNDVEKQKYLKEKLQSIIKESIVNVREVSNALSPYILRKYGLRSAVKSFFDNSKDFIKIAYKTNLTEERFPINVETVYFRIIKELFNNTIKHANAKNVSLTLNYKAKQLVLTYQDDGKGIDQEDLKNLEHKGMGLFNITNRIISVHGEYEFFTDLNKGFKFQMKKELETL